MCPDTCLPSVVTPRRGSSSTLPVLIQVPSVRTAGRRWRRAAHSGPHVRARRRRLRREVRVAGTGLLLVGMPACALLFLTGLRPGAPALGAPEGARSRSRPLAPAQNDAPVVSISLDVTGVATEDAEVPVVRPAGYILPDEGAEEAAHAGS